MPEWFVYILECSDGTFYTGITNNIEKRLIQHNEGKGAKYTRGRSPHELVFREVFINRSLATKRESQIKALKKEKKLELILSYSKSLVT